MKRNLSDLEVPLGAEEIILSCEGEHLDLPLQNEEDLEMRTLELIGSNGEIFEIEVPLTPGRTLEELVEVFQILAGAEIRPIHIGSKSKDLAGLPLSKYIQERLGQVAPGIKRNGLHESGALKTPILDDPDLRIRENTSPYDHPNLEIPTSNELVIIEDISVLHVPGVTLPPSKNAYSVGKWVAEDLEKKFESGRNEPVEVLELCSGSGVINLSLLKNAGSKVRVFASDINSECVDLNKTSAQYNEIYENQLKFGAGDLYEAVPENQKFDYVVANPPFFDQKAALKVIQEDRYSDHVPLAAIDGGEDGLDFYRRILLEGLPFLKKGGKFVFEVSSKISPLVRALSSKILPTHPRSMETISDGKDVGHIAKGFIVAIEPF